MTNEQYEKLIDALIGNKIVGNSPTVCLGLGYYKTFYHLTYGDNADDVLGAEELSVIVNLASLQATNAMNVSTLLRAHMEEGKDNDR